MGELDTRSKDYLRQPEVFADAFNYYVHDGRQVILPEHLSERDITELFVPFDTESKERSIQKYRDLLKLAVIAEDETATYLMLGIEAQGRVDYAMPVRNALYDALQYARQVAEISASHRQNHKQEHISSSEYLSGFYKGDRLLPVITLVLLLSPDEWDGPLTLHEMMDVQDEKLLTLVPDYRLNLITPHDLEDGDLEKFHSSLREVLEFIKYSQDKQKLHDIVSRNDRYLTLDSKAAALLNSCTKVKINIHNKKEEINMCKAIDDMMEDARQENLLKNLKSLMKNLSFTADQAFAALEVPASDQENYRALLQTPITENALTDTAAAQMQ